MKKSANAKEKLVQTVERIRELKSREKSSLSGPELRELKELQLERKALQVARGRTSIASKIRKEEQSKRYLLGGLVVAAGLADWDQATLMGGLMILAQQDDPGRLATLRKAGGAYFTRAKARKEANRPLIEVRFPSGVKQEIITAIQSKGMNWNQERQFWQGRVSLSSIKRIVDQARGTMVIHPPQLSQNTP